MKRVVDRSVHTGNQYLWKLSGGLVLVHLGDGLTEFDPQLKPLRTLHVVERIAWVVSSPDAAHIAIGVVKERYNKSTYMELGNTLLEAPEEDLEIRIVDRDLQPKMTASGSSKMPVPILSDSGEIRIRGEGNHRWRMTEYRWDHTERRIAAVKSSCRPLLSAPHSNLIFAVGCSSSGGHWYRMFGEDGHPLLKGESSSNEIEQSAEATSLGDFAVRIAKAAKPMSYGQPFRKLDLTQETIVVYRKSDGGGLFEVRSKDFTLSQAGFALSPAGDQIAVLGGSSLLLFTPKRPVRNNPVE